MLDDEQVDLERQLKGLGYTCSTARERPSLLEGLCDDPLDTHALEPWPCRRITCAGAFAVLCPHAAVADAKEPSLHADAVWHTVGRVLSGRSLSICVSDEFKGDTLPTAVAAGFRCRGGLMALLADGWWADTWLVQYCASENDMPLLRAMCDATGCRFEPDLLTHVAVAVAAARNGCEETLQVVAAREKGPPEALSKAATAGRVACAHCKKRYTPATAAVSRCTDTTSHLWRIYEWS